MYICISIALTFCLAASCCTLLAGNACPILWQLVREQVGPVDTITVGERLGLVNPSRQKLRQLALAHICYHNCRKDNVVISLMIDFCKHNSCTTTSSSSSSNSSCSSTSSSSDHETNPWPIVQQRAVGFCRAGESIIGPP